MNVAVHVVKVPFSWTSAGLERALAVCANDYDVAGGAMVSGFELDALEEAERQAVADLERAFLLGYGNERQVVS